MATVFIHVHIADTLQLSSVSIGNSIQSYSTLVYTQRVYSVQPNQVTPLSARTFGTWTFVAAIVRLYAAYHINEPHMYQLAFAMFLGANFHFLSEWLYFKTAKWGTGLSGPIIISTVSLVWMLAQWDYYTKS
jgi:Erg28 like protein